MSIYEISEEITAKSPYKFEMKLKIVRDLKKNASIPGYSTKIAINAMIEFQAMFFDMQEYTVQCFMKFRKIQENDKSHYRVLLCNTLESDKSKVVKKEFPTDDSWHSLGDKISINQQDYAATYIIQMETQKANSINFLTTIHEDLDYTDFELRGIDGSVRMHKAVAAASSPFFKTLFSGSWQETAAGIVDVPDTSVSTLQCLKDYMYLGKEPKSDLKPLLLLSSCYMLDDLASMCSHKLSREVTSETVVDLLDFALKHKQYKILYGIFQLVSEGGFNLDEMKALYN